jgi:DeoR family transcriptional regulator, aga operon transcriptional repressor
MLHIDRRKDLLDLIMQEGSVRVRDLAARYGVGEATIRRDLKYLSEEYGVQLSYGGAYVKEHHHYGSIVENNIEIKRAVNYERKQIIARKAASLVKDGDTIALNAGSTVEFILDHLKGFTKINVITLCLNVLVKAASIPFIDVYVPGGKLRSFSGAFYGGDTEEFLRRFNVDKCFFGVLAVSIKKGITHPALEEVNSNRALLEISEKRYLTADSSKYNAVSLAKMADLHEFSGFLDDGDIPDEYRKYADLHDIQII